MQLQYRSNVKLHLLALVNCNQYKKSIGKGVSFANIYPAKVQFTSASKCNIAGTVSQLGVNDCL